MSEVPDPNLPAKIARLVEERGWNQEDFARISNLNRHTVAQILHAGSKRRMRNATVSQCAEALGLTVNELRTLPLERLLPRMNGTPVVDDDVIKSLYERARMQDLVRWVERNQERASQLTPAEAAELLALQGPEGPIAKLGVEHFVELIERKRRVIGRIHVIAGTEYLGLLEQLVELLHDKVRPG